MAAITATVTNLRDEGQRGGDPTHSMDRLRFYIDNQLEQMNRFRTRIGIVDRLNTCVRLREGQYEPQQLQAIAEMGGSQVFARVATNKIRGAAAMLRSIFIQGDRPWELKPTPVPTLPEDINAAIQQVVTSEVTTLQQSGQQITPEMIEQRTNQLKQAATEAARQKARMDALEATRYVDDILVEGEFYSELNSFLLDFCTFPFAVMAGPTAVMRTGVDYVNGIPTRVRKAKLLFRRVDPYNIMWSPGAPSLQKADILERIPMSRADLNALIGLDGYDADAIRSVIREYGGSGHSYRQFYEAVHEEALSQDNVFYNTQIDVLAFTGRLLGSDLKDMGIKSTDEDETLQDDLDYQVQAWMCGEYILKAQIDPDPSNRPSYYSAAYEPVAGSIPGTALLELFSDVLEAYNATLRAMINNIAIASGPQVGINTSRWNPPADGKARVTPWQVWRIQSDPTAQPGEKPIEFFQPQLNAQELIGVLSFLQNMADEISGIPRYLTGSDKIGGAGRTSSGLSMLMGNATRTMTSVAGGIDEQILEPLLRKTYDLVLLTTGTDILRGDEDITARGATYAEQREQDRMRMIELLNATANPYDMAILGIPGRGKLLRKVSDSFMGDEELVPSDQALMQLQQAQTQQAQQAQQVQDPNATDETGQSAGGSGQGGNPQGGPAGSQGGGTPAKPAPQRGSAQHMARETDNSARARKPGAISRQTRRAA